MINRIPFLLFFITSLILFQTVETKASDFAMADSMRVRWIDGKKFILHKVEPKQTWNLLAKKYNCSVQDLKDSNTGVTELKIGQIINVPVPSPDTKPGTGTKVTEKTTDNPEPVKSTPASAKNVSKAKTPVYHVVLQGETLYGISKKYNKTVDEVKALNNLPSNAVIKDQKLIVGYENDNTVTPALIPVQAPATSAKTEKAEVKSEKVIPVTTKPLKDDNLSVTTTPTSTVNNFDRATKTVSPIKKSNGGRTLMQVNETGVASWIQDGQLNQDKYYGLHRTAPIGTIIKVTNRMNNQFVYVKIVGVLPDTGDNDNVIIKVSQAVSSKLNALDSLFQVDLSYGIMQ